MKKVLLSFAFFPIFLLLASPAHAVELFGTFTASDVHYNPSTNELSFHASNFSQPVTQASAIGITNCNTSGCSVEGTEFYAQFPLIAITDPYDFDAILSVNSYRPSSGTVYVEFSDAGFTYQRMWSQPLNYDDIISTGPNIPTNKSQCKKGQWKDFLSLFKNQGQCVSFTNK